MSAIKPRIRTVHIYQGDYDDRIAELKRQIEAAQTRDDAPRVLGDPSPVPDLIAQHDALVEEAKADAVVVKLRNLGRRSYHDLKVKHPPRDDNDADKAMGTNEDGFFDELLPLSTVSVEGTDEPLKTDSELARFYDDLAPIDYEKVKFAAFALNEMAAPDPKLFHVSRPTPENDET